MSIKPIFKVDKQLLFIKLLLADLNCNVKHKLVYTKTMYYGIKIWKLKLNKAMNVVISKKKR